MADAQIYEQQAHVIRTIGIRRGFRCLAEDYLENRSLWEYPSPIRWGWILALRYVRRLPLVSGIALAPLAITSPLLWTLARGKLQDTWIALLTVLAMVACWFGSGPGLALALFALVASKEVGALAVPSVAILWLARGWPIQTLALWCACGLAGYCVATLAVLGRLAFPILRTALSGHETEYTRQHQRGHWHRLLVDLVLVSPLPVMLALIGAPNNLPLAIATGALIAAHAVAPVRNVRTILVADILMRVIAALTLIHAGWIWAIPGFAVCILADALILRRVGHIYDPVTGGLAMALGMPGR